MKAFSFAILLAVLGHAHAIYRVEFGRLSKGMPELKRKSIPEVSIEDRKMTGFGKEKTPSAEDMQILRELEEVIDGDFMELSMSMSMSLSYSYDATPGTLSPVTPQPLTTFSPSSSLLPSDYPSLAPSGAPTEAERPTVAIGVTDVPASSSPPTNGASSTEPEQAFECSPTAGIVQGEKSEESTSLFLLVGFMVESTSNSTDDFVDALERQLLATAAGAALGCGENFGNLITRRLGSFRNRPRKLLTKTTQVGRCETTAPQSKSCFLLETELLFLLNGDVNVDEASYTGYLAVEKQMTDNSYVNQGNIPTVQRFVFLSPLNLVPPQQNDVGQPTKRAAGSDSSFIFSNESSQESRSFSIWTIGVCVATIIGGLASILIWSKNRRFLRERRHLQLLDDDSLADGEYQEL